MLPMTLNVSTKRRKKYDRTMKNDCTGCAACSSVKFELMKIPSQNYLLSKYDTYRAPSKQTTIIMSNKALT